MKRSNCLLLALSLAVVAHYALPASAVDFESFQFDDGAGTALEFAANAANPTNFWFEDVDMSPSDVRGGSYNIVKESDVLDNNYLQIDNITSGTRYLVVGISGWKFGEFANDLEEVRFGFVNEDTGNSGNTVTAQMAIQRDSNGDVALVGDALGSGTAIAGTAPLTDQRSTPLTIALELNKSANTYRVYYKDNAEATQVLGLGTVDPGRAGNAIRFSVNNSFGEGNLDYPFVPADEVFSIDSIRLTDTNPFNDLITLEIDRVSGSMTLKNTSGTALTGLESYSIESPTGPFDSANWKTVTGNYDSTGTGSVDNAPWMVTSSTKSLLSESFQSGDGGGLTIGQNVVLSTGMPAGGTWLKSPFEDATMELNFASGTRSVAVNYVGNGGVGWKIGDLNFDNDITVDDYSVLVQFAETSLAGLSRVEAYQRGDLDGDGINSTLDFLQFKDLYEDANGGAGSFALMLSKYNAVPEPAGATLIAIAAGLLTFRRRRDKPQLVSTSPSMNRDLDMPRPATLIRPIFAAVLIALAATTADAAILEDFQFSESNGTLLEDAENSADSIHTWQVHTNTVESSVLNGSFRINKQSATTQASNVLEIDNITSGKAWLVAEIAGWNYTSTPSSPSERVRLGFLDNDMPTTGSNFVTAEATIDRGDTGLELNGFANGTPGATNLDSGLNLPLVRNDPFTIALELDKTADTYTVYYKDNTNPFQPLGTGQLGPSSLNEGDRDGNSIRFAFTGTFGDVGEFFDVSRIYLTTDDPVGPVDPIALTLEVKSNGLVSIVNHTNDAISFDTYRIASPDGSLDFDGWSPLAMLDAVGGGDEVGETWTPSAGSNDDVLAETFLLGESTVDPEEIIPLGSAFKIGGSENLTFQYRDTVSGTLVTGLIDYVEVAGLAGDYNNDGIVDAADYTVWRNNLGELTEDDINNNGNGSGGVDAADYTWWKERYGNTNLGAGSGGFSLQAVPEPTALSIICLALISLAPCRRAMRR